MNQDSNQETQALSVAEIARLYLSQWRLFAFIAILLGAGSLVFYAFKVPYVSSGVLTVNDSQNSSLQAFSSQFFGLSKSVQESKKGNSLLAKHLEFLKTRDFQEALAARLVKRGEAGKITLEEKKGYQLLRELYLPEVKTEDLDKQIAFMQTLAKWIKVSLDAEFEIKIVAATGSREISLFVANTALELSKDLLKNREQDEMQQVEKFIAVQKQKTDDELASLNQQLAEYQNKDETLLPLVSKDKMGDYVSELMVRANELKLKISENKKMISYLQNGRPQGRESKLYGVGARIETLTIENRILADKLGQLQISLNQMKQQVKRLPIAAQMADDLKKKSEIEFTKYKELSAALSKIEAQKLSIDTRFDILEKARWETTGPQISLLTLMLLSVLLSQVLGSIYIYFRFLWNPNEITAQASRNLMIFDGHSLDPRVIIENSKIKFSLKNYNLNEEKKAEAQAKLLENVRTSDQSH